MFGYVVQPLGFGPVRRRLHPYLPLDDGRYRHSTLMAVHSNSIQFVIPDVHPPIGNIKSFFGTLN